MLKEIRKNIRSLAAYVVFSQICKATYEICDELFWKVVCTAAGYGMPNKLIKREGVINVEPGDPRYEMLANPKPENRPVEPSSSQKLDSARFQKCIKLTATSEMTGTYANLARCVLANGLTFGTPSEPHMYFEAVPISDCKQ